MRTPNTDKPGMLASRILVNIEVGRSPHPASVKRPGRFGESGESCRGQFAESYEFVKSGESGEFDESSESG